MAPYAAGLVGLAVVLLVLSAAFELRTRRHRCLRCCEAAGYPSMVYAREYRGGPRDCTCSDRSIPEKPRSDSLVCLGAGRKARPR